MVADRLSSVFWLVIGLIAIYGSVKLGIGGAREPGSGFLPLLASLSISLIALGILLQTFLKTAKSHRTFSSLWQGLRWKRSLYVCLITVGYTLIFEKLGFALSTSIFLMALLKGMESIAWGKALLISVLSTGLCYLLLSFSLESTLPKGILGF